VLKGSPTCTYELTFDSKGSSNLEYISSEENTDGKPLALITLRECDVGEEFLDTGECQICPQNTSFLL